MPRGHDEDKKSCLLLPLLLPLPLPLGSPFPVLPLEHSVAVDLRPKSAREFSNSGWGYCYCGYILLPFDYVPRFGGDFAHRGPKALNSVCASPRTPDVCVCACMCSVCSHHLLVQRRRVEDIVREPVPNVEGARAQAVVAAACGEQASTMQSRPHHPHTNPTMLPSPRSPGPYVILFVLVA